jgi:uncharacterized protein
MTRRQPIRQKRVPQRMCIACRQGAGKRHLIRIVRTDEGVKVDPTGKLSGRGAYLHPNSLCWYKAIEHRMLQRALHTQISTQDLAMLKEYAATLPDEPEQASDTGNQEAQA